MSELRMKALDLYKAPFQFQMGYIYDAEWNMVCDDKLDLEAQDAALSRIRGWGRIKYQPNPEALQDEVGAIIAQALTEFWERNSAK